MKPLSYGSSKFILLGKATVNDLRINTWDTYADLEKKTRESIELDFFGVKGDKHNGPTRRVSVQDYMLYKDFDIPKGTQIFNDTQVSAVHWSEVTNTMGKLGIEQPGDNLIAGYRSNIGFTGKYSGFSYLPVGTKIVFNSGKRNEVALIVSRGINPCTVAQQYLESITGKELKGFIRHAHNQRGLAMYVSKPGKIKLGAVASFFAPQIST